MQSILLVLSALVVHPETMQTLSVFSIPIRLVISLKLREMIRRWVAGWVAGSSHLDNRATSWPHLQAGAMQDFKQS